MKSQEIADICIAVLATLSLINCWDRGGWMFQAGLVWAGANIGYIMTTYLNKGEEE